MLYLGGCKSESLFVRLGHHFNGEGEHTALKLGHKKRDFLLGHVQVLAFPLKAEYKKYAEFIVPFIESKMHEKFKPIAGSSRT